MTQGMRDRLNALLAYAKERLGETSTHVGIAFLLGAWAVKHGYDPANVTFIVAIFCGIVKATLPDKVS